MSDPRRLVGTVISGRYRIDELIGEGGMGAVYRAEHTHMRKRLAVKVLHPEMLDLAEAVERFEREAIAGAHIEHPNVAAANDFGKLEDGSHFLVLEYLEGEDLRSVLGSGPLAPDRALRIARQMALALRAAHQIGIVHRDLKPENVMLIKKDREIDLVKVLDFGIAKVPVNELTTRGAPGAQALTKLGMVYGTPEYMAPEQALGQEVDGRADLYALGVIFYEMLCGVRPFDSDSRVALLGMVATKSPPPLAVRVPGVSVPAQVEEVVMRLLQKLASARYASADELLEAIDVAALELDYPAGAGRVSRADLSRASPDRSGPHRPPQPSLDLGLTVTGGVAPAIAATTAPRPSPSARSRTPTSALLLGAGMALALLLVGTSAALRGGDTVVELESGAAGSGRGRAAPAPEPLPPSERASTAELEAARTQGIPTLTKLAEQFPRDPLVLKALMAAHAREPAGQVAALGVARRLLEADPESATGEDVRRLVTAAASGPADVSSLAFDLMSTGMGTYGPDLIYEMWITSPRLKDRAAKALADPAVVERSTPALRVATQLRAATSCDAKKPILDRAGADGDRRAVAILAPLIVQKASGCGFLGMQGCPAPCSKIASDISKAIDAIERREAARPPGGR